MPPPELLEVSFTWSPASPTGRAPVTFTAVAAGTPPYQLTWDIDGVTATGAVVATTLRPGLRTVTLRVRDALGAEATATHHITVLSQVRRRWGQASVS